MIHETAEIAPNLPLPSNIFVWHYAQIREGVVFGENCVIGRGAYVGPGVKIGSNCKIQNYSQIYEPAELGNGVFIGPAVVLTNDKFPRAINADGNIKSAADWEPVGVVIKEGASIGAGSVCVAPVEIGAWSMVAAGSVVINDVPNFATVAGVPAKQIGWVGRAGHPLIKIGTNNYECPVSGNQYTETNGELIEILR